MAAPVQVGQIVGGKYEVERVLAQGGIGLVVKARHVQLQEACAIKFLLPEALETPMVRERFLREARACARLRSDHVVKVFDVGELDPRTPYMVLEYLEGVDLETRMEAGPLPAGEAALYTLQVCAALAEAHALGIIHRDIKPGNVFLARRDDGTTRVKLLDFGISKVLGETAGVDQAQTMEGTVMGTPSCMAPEQARGEAVDARTDIWAVGVLLYHLLTGVFPFDDPAPFKTLDKILADEPEPPSRHVLSIPPELDRIVLHCLEKDPARRPAGVDQVAAALAPFADEGGTPISLHVRRVFESLADGRASLPPSSSVPAPATISLLPPPAPPPAILSSAPAPLPARSPWRVAAAAAGLFVAAAAGIALAPRRHPPAPVPLPAAASVEPVEAPVPAVVTAPVVTAVLPVITPPPAASSSARVPPKPPRAPSRSAGFDLGSRR